MKEIVLGFLRRGLVACGFGPMVLAVVYLILQRVAGVETLTVHEVCVGILSLTALAFLAGGMNVVYKIEQLPLMSAILIHGGALYVGYLTTYIINGWIQPIHPFPSVRHSVPVGVAEVGVGAEGDFLTVVEAVEVRVGQKRVGERDERLVDVDEAVGVGVGVEAEGEEERGAVRSGERLARGGGNGVGGDCVPVRYRGGHF